MRLVATGKFRDMFGAVLQLDFFEFEGERKIVETYRGSVIEWISKIEYNGQSFMHSFGEKILGKDYGRILVNYGSIKELSS